MPPTSYWRQWQDLNEFDAQLGVSTGERAIWNNEDWIVVIVRTQNFDLIITTERMVRMLAIQGSDM